MGFAWQAISQKWPEACPPKPWRRRAKSLLWWFTGLVVIVFRPIRDGELEILARLFHRAAHESACNHYTAAQLGQPSGVGERSNSWEESRMTLSPADKPPIEAPMIPVSWGELFDKITILEIKARHIANQEASARIAEELGRLKTIAASVHAKNDIMPLIAELKRTNETLWECEDRIRRKERQGAFDGDFIALARSIYLTNDQRAALKRQISVALASVLVEEKWYGDQP